MDKLNAAAAANDIEQLSTLLHAVPSLLHSKNAAGRTVMHSAVAGGHVLVVKYMMHFVGAESLLDVKANAGDTPLSLYVGPIEILQLLYRGGGHPPAASVEDTSVVDAIAAAHGRVLLNQPGDALDAPVHDECDAYDTTNAMLHGAFAAATMLASPQLLT